MKSKRKRFSYKGVRIGTFGIPIYDDEDKTKEYKKPERIRDFYSPTFDSPFKSDSPKNLLLIYDIPSDKNVERDWFRRQLQRFGYIMIQRSVWVGPSPLPLEFVKYIKEIGIENNFQTFNLAKSYTEKK